MFLLLAVRLTPSRLFSLSFPSFSVSCLDIFHLILTKESPSRFISFMSFLPSLSVCSFSYFLFVLSDHLVLFNFILFRLYPTQFIISFPPCLLLLHFVSFSFAQLSSCRLPCTSLHFHHLYSLPTFLLISSRMHNFYSLPTFFTFILSFLY